MFVNWIVYGAPVLELADDEVVCHHHHRLVHEGGWQVIRTGDAITFLPPDRSRAA